jgi:exonuclease SbcC
MKLETLKVNNIRSIKKLELEFPDTTILFYGDIGSGKSSILKAIEFGLFGTMGELSSSSLLRRGQNNAQVELTFSIGDDRYIIHRELKKKIKDDKETISQLEGWLIENDIKTSYTATELRTRILELLNYSTTKYKSTSKKCVDIFRYTVYTPQEEIKEILKADPKERFEILKDVLEIEKYENSLKNLENIKKDISKQLRDIDYDIKTIGSPEEAILEIEKGIATKKEKIKTQTEQINFKRDGLTKERTTLVSLQGEYNEYTIKIAVIQSKQGEIKKDTEMISKNEKSILLLSNEVIRKQEEADEIPQIQVSTNKNEDELEDEIKALRTDGEIISKELITCQNKVSDVEKLLKEGKCSLCGQAIHDKKRFDTELKDAKEKINRLSGDLNDIKMQIGETEVLLKKIREKNKSEQKRKGILEVIKGKKDHQVGLIETNKELTSHIEMLKVEISRALKEHNIKAFKETETYGMSLKEKRDAQQEVIDKLLDEITQLEKNLSKLETESENAIDLLKNAKEALDRKQELKSRQAYLNNVKIWVTDQFPVLLKDIERTILATTASLFNQYFKEWFRALVEEENIDIQIDPENFQPIVIVDGYESPFDDLSGGERSALSLAYRLALNKVINTKHQDVKTKDLLILDEPTEGFSEQQVNKMQGVFDTLNVKQMIIISHERTLDSLVSRTFNFKKTNHQTKVTIENL